MFNITIFNQVIFFKFLIYFKIVRFNVIVRRMEDIFITKQNVRNVVEVVKLFLTLFTIIHIASCLFFGIA